VAKETEPQGRQIITIYTRFDKPEYTLVVVKSRSVVLRTWFTLKSEMFIIFGTSVVLIILLVFKFVAMLVKNMREADERRKLELRLTGGNRSKAAKLPGLPKPTLHSKIEKYRLKLETSVKEDPF
jgi:hypothetical protein